MGRIELPSEPWQGPVIAAIRHPHGAEGQCPHCGFPFNSACNLTSEHSRHSVLSHHLSLHQPVLKGKPTPSNCLTCCFRGSNNPEAGPNRSQLKVSHVRFCSGELPLFPAMSPRACYISILVILSKGINPSILVLATSSK